MQRPDAPAAWKCDCPGLGPRPETVTRCLTCGAERPTTTPQDRVMAEARHLFRQLDEGRVVYSDQGETGMVARIDFAIGATLHLRSLVREYDEAVSRG